MATFGNFFYIIGYFWLPDYQSFLNRKKKFIKFLKSKSFLKIEKLFRILRVKIAFKKLFSVSYKRKKEFTIKSELNLETIAKLDMNLLTTDELILTIC